MSEPNTAWIGVDVGTTGCRVLALRADGEVAAVASRSLVSHRPRQGWHEQDPAAWIGALSAACRQVMGSLSGWQIGAVSISATSGTVLLGDVNARPLTRAVMYDDQRAIGDPRTQVIQRAWADCGRRNGYQVQPTWALPKIAWLLHHVRSPGPALVYHCADFLSSWLVGQRVPADWSHALKSGFDLIGRRWPAAAFAESGVPLAVMPQVVRPGAPVGVTSTEAQADTGLPAGTPVVAGMTDGCASQLASGTVRPGQWNLALGTTFVLKGVSAALLRGEAIYSHRHPDDGWLPGGASSSGAGALRSLFPDADLAALDHAARERGPTDAVRYPLVGRGERFPFVCPDAEPFELGSPAGQIERYSAVLQGVALVERLSLDYVASLGGDVSGRIAITGGATRSSYLNQLRADALGRTVVIPRYPETAFGAAVLAASLGRTLAETAEGLVTEREAVHPRQSGMEKLLATYRRLVAELWKRGYITAELHDLAGAA